MPALSQSRFLRFLTFGTLYFAQGLPAGFITVSYVVLLTDLGLSNQAIGSTLGLAALPGALKIFWGPLLDRVGSTRFGRRRPFIILAQLAMGATLPLLLLVDPKRDPSLLTVVIFLFFTFATFQDVAVDALAVDVLQPEEQGTANGVMWAGKSVGAAVGGGAMIARRLGWPALIFGISVLLWAIMLLVILVRERPRAQVPSVRVRPKLTLAELYRSFGFATPLVGIAIAMLTPLGSALIPHVYTRLLRADLKLSVEAISAIEGSSVVASVMGALAGGVLADRLGARKVIGGLMLCTGATMALFPLAPDLRSSFTFLACWSGAGALLIGAHTAAMLGFLMSISNPAVGATQFCVFMASANFTSVWAAPLGGWIADTFGAGTLFAVAAAVQVVFIGLLPFCDPRVAQARFRPEAVEGVPEAEAV
jgi:PAT family beta-lactamase induction signal transducer AmpG